MMLINCLLTNKVAMSNNQNVHLCLEQHNLNEVRTVDKLKYVRVVKPRCADLFCEQTSVIKHTYYD